MPVGLDWTQLDSARLHLHIVRPSASVFIFNGLWATSEAKIRAISSAAIDQLRAGRLADGQTPGLFLEVTKGGKKVWKYRRRMSLTDAYLTSRRERKKVEMLFAHLKRILKLDRLRLRGPNGAKDEFLLAATAQNLRKLAKLIPVPVQPVPA